MTAAEAATLPGSLTLWRTWFEKGYSALAENASGGPDFEGAVAWLRQALQQIPPGSDTARRGFYAQAHYAWGLFQLADSYRDRARQAEEKYWAPVPDCRRCSPSIGSWKPPVQIDPAAALALAQQMSVAAVANAEAALPRLGWDKNRPVINLATARAAHIVAEASMDLGDTATARERFDLARSYYVYFPGEKTALDTVYGRLFSLCYHQCDFQAALRYLRVLQDRVAQRVGEQEWIAKLLACEGDVLLQLCRYREAADLAARWKPLVSNPANDHLRDRAYGCAVFGRALVIVGRFDEAGEILLRGHCIAATLRPVDLAVRFDLYLATGDLARRLGDFVEAARLLDAARAGAPPDHARQVALLTALGRLDLELGREAESRKCFVEGERVAEKCFGNRPWLLIPPLAGMARLESRSSNWPAAVELARRGLCVLEQRESQPPAELGWMLQELAVACLSDDMSDEAGPVCERAGRQLEMALGSECPELIENCLACADYYLQRGMLDQAREACMQASRTLSGPREGHLLVFARVAVCEGQIFHLEDDHCSARCCIDNAWNAWLDQERTLGHEIPDKALILLSLATLEAGEGRDRHADTAFKQLKPSFLKLKGSSARAGYECNRRGNLFKRLRKFREARWLYKRAFDLYAKECGSDHPFCRQIAEKLQRTEVEFQAAHPEPAEPAPRKILNQVVSEPRKPPPQLEEPNPVQVIPWIPELPVQELVPLPMTKPAPPQGHDMSEPMPVVPHRVNPPAATKKTQLPPALDKKLELQPVRLPEINSPKSDGRPKKVDGPSLPPPAPPPGSDGPDLFPKPR